jgi:hypothetical protein
MTPSVVLYRFFSLFFSKFVCRLTYIGTLISCLFLGGKYFKSMFCWHITRQQWVKEWFENQLMPALKNPSLVVIDNASYHNVKTEDTVCPNFSQKKLFSKTILHNTTFPFLLLIPKKFTAVNQTLTSLPACKTIKVCLCTKIAF